MPTGSLNVYLGGTDQLSPMLVSITDKTRALDKESQELQQTFDALQEANKGLIERKTELQKELKAVNEEVKEARKNFNALQDEVNTDAYEKAQEKQQKLRDQIAATTKALQENQKIYKENIETIRKGGMEEQDTNLGSIAKGLVAGQIGQMFSSALGGLGESALTSMIGTPEASLISDTLSSAIAGGAAGMIAGPVGAAIGTGIGALSGLISGGTKIFEAQDDAFKEYYGGLYDDVKGRSGEMVEAGTTLASGRETNRISFKTLFGDEKVAQRYLENLIDMANYTPFLYDDLVSMSKTLATYGYSPDAGSEYYILDALQTIGDTGAALGMGTSDMSTVAQALGRMKSSDKATLEYLNMLNDRGIGAVGMLAEAKGVSQGDMYSMISKSKISGTEAVEIIMAALKETYTGSMEEQSRTFDGLSSTLEGLQQNLDALGGEGYNALRGEGIKEEINALGGSLGEALGEINAIMGENQARRENLEAQYMREALEAVLLGKQGSVFSGEENAKLAELSAQYAELKERYDSGDTEAGLELEALYETAQALGQSYYDNSEYVQTLTDVEMDEIQAILDNTAGLNNLNTVIYDLPQRLSVGRAGTTENKEKIAEATGTLFPGLAAGGLFLGGSTDAALDMLTGSSHAFGLDRVPYDDYPALLHQGERVLTASEARAQDAGQMAAPIQIPITGNTFLGMPEEVADQIAEIIVRKLAQAAIAAAPK